MSLNKPKPIKFYRHPQDKELYKMRRESLVGGGSYDIGGGTKCVGGGSYNIGYGDG